MATRSTISILNLDGTVRQVYCHWDGYLENNGVILNTCYNTEDKVNALIDLGAMSGLETELDQVRDYHRMRGEEINIRQFDGEILKNAREHWREEFNYIFDVNEGVWYVAYDSSPEMHKLENELKSLELV